MRRADRARVALTLALLLAAVPLRAAAAAERLVPSETLRDLRAWLGGLAPALLRGGDAAQAPPPPGPAPAALPAAGASGPSVDPARLERPAELEASLRAVLAQPAAARQLTVQGGQGRIGHYSVGSDQRVSGHLVVLAGTADLFGTVGGNVVTLDGDVVLHPGAEVEGDVLAIGGRVRDQGGRVRGAVQTARATGAAPRRARDPEPAPSVPQQIGLRLAGLTGVWLTLLLTGIALVIFARPNLETVSDTATFSFGRAFVTGLLGQLLLLPTFGMLVVFLVLSVAGILLLPFAVILYGLLVLTGVVGGFLAVAHAMGETWTRRRLARGALGSPNSFRYLVAGLAAPALLWLVWALFGWVPIAGEVMRAAAILGTWMMVSTGLGATMLSRAGLRENFAGRILPAETFTDEYLWATPQFGVPAVKRPTSSSGKGRIG